MNIFYFEIVLPQSVAAYVKRSHQKQNYPKLDLKVSSALNKHWRHQKPESMLLTTSGVGMPACAEPDTIPFLSTYWNCFTNILLHISVTYPVPGTGRIGFKFPAERYQHFFFFFFPWNINVIYISFKGGEKKVNSPHNFEAFVFDVFSLSSLSQFVDLTFLITKATKHWGLLKQNLWDLSTCGLPT